MRWNPQVHLQKKTFLLMAYIDKLCGSEGIKETEGSDESRVSRVRKSTCIKQRPDQEIKWYFLLQMGEVDQLCTFIKQVRLVCPNVFLLK